MKRLRAGVIPHFMIPHTLGALANANANGVVPYLKDIFNITLPLLGGCRFDPLKQSFAFGKSQYIFSIFNITLFILIILIFTSFSYWFIL